MKKNVSRYLTRNNKMTENIFKYMLNTHHIKYFTKMSFFLLVTFEERVRYMQREVACSIAGIFH